MAALGPVSFLAAAAIVAAATLVAAAPHAHRAARTDPNLVLRQE